MTRTCSLSWSPAQPYALADDLLREFFTKPKTNETTQWRPRVDVIETSDAYLLRAELPGLDPETIDITLLDRTLTLAGEKADAQPGEGDRRHVLERAFGSFKRTFTFPEVVDAESVTAKSEHGLLLIEVKKVPEVQPTKITIKSS
jgi:HSP20 family protein